VKNLLVLAILAAIAWYGYGKYKFMSVSPAGSDASVVATAPAASQASPSTSAQFSCDGRTHCSQMRSCAEATYFIKHCPSTKIDGNNDGVPCERQWCN